MLPPFDHAEVEVLDPPHCGSAQVAAAQWITGGCYCHETKFWAVKEGLNVPRRDKRRGFLMCFLRQG